MAECDYERRSRVSEENEFLRFRFNCNHLIMLKYCSVIHSYTQIVVFLFRSNKCNQIWWFEIYNSNSESISEMRQGMRIKMDLWGSNWWLGQGFVGTCYDDQKLKIESTVGMERRWSYLTSTIASQSQIYVMEHYHEVVEHAILSCVQNTLQNDMHPQ